MTTPCIEYKHPEDVKTLSADFSNFVTGGVTISSVSWTAANGVTTSGASGATVRSILVSGGKEGCDYLVTCKATFSTNEVKDVVFLVKVRTLGRDPRLVRG